MTELIANGISKSRSASLTGISRSMIYYRHRERKPEYDADLERRISSIVEERPSYGTRRVTAMIRRSGIMVGRNRIRRHMRHMNLIATHRKAHRKHVPRTIVVARPNIMWETDFTKIYIDSERWVYLTAYLDLCSRKIKGYLVSCMPGTAEMMEALDNALLGTFPDMNVTGLRIRSDNGSQLTSSFMKSMMKDDRYLAVDLTHVLSMSEGIISATLGHNSMDQYLPQVQVLFLYSLDHDRPSYFRMLPGSVNSVASLKMTMQETDVSNIVLVADSGFYSAGNIRDLDDLGISYIMPLKRNSRIIRYDHGRERHFMFQDHPIFYWKHS